MSKRPTLGTTPASSYRPSTGPTWFSSPSPATFSSASASSGWFLASWCSTSSRSCSSLLRYSALGPPAWFAAGKSLHAPLNLFDLVLQDTPRLVPRLLLPGNPSRLGAVGTGKRAIAALHDCQSGFVAKLSTQLGIVSRVFRQQSRVHHSDGEHRVHFGLLVGLARRFLHLGRHQPGLVRALGGAGLRVSSGSPQYQSSRARLHRAVFEDKGEGGYSLGAF